MKDGSGQEDELTEVGPDAPELEEPLVFEEPLDAAIRERDELKALVQRVQADFVNYRNRVAVEREEIRRGSTKRLAVRVLDSVDQFEAALGADRPDGVEDSWFEGFDGIRRSLLQVLSSEGIEPYETAGELFDPRLHEALLTAESDEVPASTVLMVLRKGYKMNDEVIRVAQVQISTAPSERSEEEE